MRLSKSKTSRLEEEARQCALYLLSSTDEFEALGLVHLSGGVRSLARLTLDLCDRLEAEASARRSIQSRADKLQKILGRRAYQECLKEPQ